MYLVLARNRLVTTREISEAYGLSFDYIAKAAQLLVREGYVEATRGRGGGIHLSKKPSEISIGQILRLTEAESGLVECMRPGPTKCVLAPSCGLMPILKDANEAFFASLDSRTLADTLPKPKAISDLLKIDTVSQDHSK